MPEDQITSLEEPPRKKGYTTNWVCAVIEDVPPYLYLIFCQDLDKEEESANGLIFYCVSF